MLIDIISYGLHLVTAFIFFVLIPLPVLLRAMKAKGDSKLNKLLRFYKIVLMIAHGALVVAVVTGFIMYFDLRSLWLWIVFLIWVAIGAYLGITAKYIRLTLERINEGAAYEDLFQKTRVFSGCLTLGVLAMFVIKYISYF